MESTGKYKDIFEKLWVCGVDLWRVYKDMNIIIKGFMHLKKKTFRWTYTKSAQPVVGGENFFSQNGSCRVSKYPSFCVDFKNVNLP
jgi:hypothetical protein